ncbi:hypothetical protein P9112_014034 [Eukaryota sp. TZLM1-RC]
MTENEQVFIQFVSEDNVPTGTPLQIPLSIETGNLCEILNSLLESQDPATYQFLVNDVPVVNRLSSHPAVSSLSTQETTLHIKYRPEASFYVRPVTRCAASLPGHSEAVLDVAFSPCGSYLASGSGDTSVRLWDLHTNTPIVTLTGHTHWVFVVSFSPDSRFIASAGMDKSVRIWELKNITSSAQKSTSSIISRPLRGHTKPITSLTWQPFHLTTNGTSLLASASKDTTIKIWNIATMACVNTLCGHSSTITQVRWSGSNLIISASQDRTIKIWNPIKGMLIRSLSGHGHWVNRMALSTDFALKTSYFNHLGAGAFVDKSLEELIQQAKDKYTESLKSSNGKELLVTGSDDFTLCLWDFESSKQMITRMTGHQQLVNDVAFSPDGRFIVSASFDKSLRLWSNQGNFISTLRGHVGAVYRVAWSCDSRMFISASKDSTLKVWDVSKAHNIVGKGGRPVKDSMKGDLPGHADEVYALDWGLQGFVASGSKDRLVKIWRH